MSEGVGREKAAVGDVLLVSRRRPPAWGRSHAGNAVDFASAAPARIRTVSHG
ncbi:hypothetical protein [Streptomyces sp. NPDC058291]|uniref:hypothetical protein n=1 Tax=Streptomyces sp. NPDC058291 TaxID=3346427 RepID=UPI0036E31FD4